MSKRKAIDTFAASKGATAVQGTPQEAAEAAQKRMKCVRVSAEVSVQMRRLGADLIREDGELMREAINLLFERYGYKPIA